MPLQKEGREGGRTELDRSVLTDQHVVRLDVPMNAVETVDVLEGCEGLRPK